MSSGTSNSSETMMKFLKERVELKQGISLQRLTGHLSQLPSDLKTKFGCSIKSLKRFLKQFPEVFIIRDEKNVYVRKKGLHGTSSLSGSVESFLTSTSERNTDKEDVTSLTGVKGSVYCTFGVYGFIAIKHPIKTSVYFDVQSFENAKHRSLLSSGLRVGDCVIFDAKIGPKDCKARFRATRVTRASIDKPPSPHISFPNMNDAGGGDCDTSTNLVNQDGVIETVKTNYGFIKFGRSQRQRAFFHANTVDKSLREAMGNLSDVFTVSDKVRFNAKVSKKPSNKVKWEATAVYLCQNNDHDSAVDSENELRKEVFWSDDESDIQDLPLAKIDECKSREAEISRSPVGYVDSDASSAKAVSSSFSIQGKKNARVVLSEWEGRQKLSGERGFFYPVTEFEGTIKFGPGRGLAACATVEVTYRDEELIDNLLWEVTDDHEVSFDAVQADDNAWIATLVWIGQRPQKPLVGDSEDVFNRIANKSAAVLKPVENTEPKQCGTFGREGSLQIVGPGSQLIEPYVSIYKGVEGIIVQIAEGIGTCDVQELSVSRKVEFRREFFYKDGTALMGDLNEVLHKGDMVFLDYLVRVSGIQEEVRCHLVWQGTRPREVRLISPDEFRQSIHIDTQDEENSLYFKDFETEIERPDEASRSPPRVPSGTGLQEVTAPRRISGLSNSLSVDGLLDIWPLVTSTATYMPSSVTRKETPTCESAPHLLFLSAGENEQVLLRLSKMVVEKLSAKNEKLRVDLRDVGVQTIDADSFSCRYSGTGGVVPTRVSLSTQTLSTGGIVSQQLFIN